MSSKEIELSKKLKDGVSSVFSMFNEVDAMEILCDQLANTLMSIDGENSESIVNILTARLKDITGENNEQ